MGGLNQTIASRYQIISLIGMGGMADVYKAQDIILNRIVAIKVLRTKLADDAMTLVRFQREAAVASRLSHPHVIDIYDVGEWQGLHYIVMEYVRGKTLKQILQQRGAFSVNEAVHTMRQLASAIDHAHQHAIIHRDIKPQNVLVKDDGTIKVTDFGIAMASDAVALTLNNAVMGSAHYLAPESAQGQEANVQVDIYALGIVFFELLTGEVPFSGSTPTEIAIKHIRENIRYVREINSAIPQSVENIVLKATAKDPSQRYQTMAPMVYDLAHCLEPKFRHVARVHIEPVRVEHVSIDHGHVVVQEEKPKSKKWPWFVLVFSCVLFLSSLTAYSLLSTPATVVLPRVQGLTVAQAKKKLTEFKSVKVRYVWSQEYVEGRVVATNIKAGSQVTYTQPIELQVSKGEGYLIRDYTGNSLVDIENQFDQAGLSLKVSVTYQNAPNTDAGIILEQSGIDPGTRIQKDATDTIAFVVSQPVTITMPNMVGQDVEAAKAYLKNQGVAVVVVGSGSTVTGQSPDAGATYTQEGTESVVTLYAN